MFRFLRTPLGIAITATTLILALSPEARKTVRRLAVKGTTAVLDFADEIKEAVNHAPEEVKSVVEEAQLEQIKWLEFNHQDKEIQPTEVTVDKEPVLVKK